MFDRPRFYQFCLFWDHAFAYWCELCIFDLIVYATLLFGMNANGA